MDIEQYRVVMKKKLNIAREKMEEKHNEICTHLYHVRHTSIKRNDVLRDYLNEIEKKLDRFYEIDKDLWIFLKDDIDELWGRVEKLQEL